MVQRIERHHVGAGCRIGNEATGQPAVRVSPPDRRVEIV
jgi:hypothetical protein